MSDITPGDWTVYEKGAEDGAQVWAREDGLAPARRLVASRLTDADAILTAAAPEMLAALKCALADLEGIMPEFDCDGDREHPAWRTIQELKRAINKAEGLGS